MGETKSGLVSTEKADASDAAAPVVSSPINVRSLGLTVLAIVAAIFTLQQGQVFFIPLVVSVLISYALGPVVTWLSRRRVPRAAGAALVLLLCAGIVGGAVYGVRDQVTDLIQQLPEAAEKLRQTVRQTRQNGHAGDAIGHVQKAAREIERAATEASQPAAPPRGVMRVQIEEPPLRVRDYLWWGSANALALAGQMIAVVFLVYFMLVSGDLFKRKLVRITGPTLSQKRITVEILDEINLQIERFLFVQLFTSTIVGVASWLAFLAFGLDQPAVWGIAAGLFNSIPYFGPVVVTGGVFVVALLQFGTPGIAALIALAAFAITSLEGFILTPWLTSRAASMNAVAIFVGLLFWSWIWGVWGTLLAVPILMVTKAVCERIEDLQPFAELLGD
jgi:predicted PurR-regulated permease PerM